MKYQATLNEKQIRVINEALELFSRLLMGQVEYTKDIFMSKMYKEDLDSQEITKTLNEVKRAIFPDMHLNASHGMGGSETDPRAQIAWDIQQVFRHRLVWDIAGNPPTRNWKQMMGVQYDEPLSFGTEPLCTITQRPIEMEYLENED